MDVAHGPNSSVFVDQCLVDDVCRHIHTSLFVSRPEAFLDRPSFFMSSLCDRLFACRPSNLGACFKHLPNSFDDHSNGNDKRPTQLCYSKSVNPDAPVVCIRVYPLQWQLNRADRCEADSLPNNAAVFD